MLVPFVPSPPEVVYEMLKCADASSNDIVLDLGCGDGRVLKIAKESFKVKLAIGVEIDKRLCREAKSIDTDIICGDLLSLARVLLSRVTILTVYLSSRANSLLEDYILQSNNKNLKIVSHDFEFSKLKLYKKVNVKAKGLLGITDHTIYCYKI
ncbi:hypothetical protein DFR86_05515 [Acidianus sulfidivorans JP7]|uniref:DOT1 domain-containing protein n=1 Tax=Acidianus sulfidivorans JP7 TaxID=619593 RepID=A0A2U9IM32_9CREN|nr:class I SAM-dependent methyltransferase [Acidianus sulfidivorans]AWR97072.1 hypothetical protein DFR86_05515 [Acidianus sulfidivorans JP7]